MVTYADMFQFGIFIVALIGLCYNSLGKYQIQRSEERRVGKEC